MSWQEISIGIMFVIVANLLIRKSTKKRPQL
jgi:hypothetical protein